MNIPAEQMDLPVTFDPFGKSLTLRQVMEGHIHASVWALSLEKRIELVVERIESQPQFEVAMIGGILDKHQAVEAVKAQTDTGKVLIEIEGRLIQNLLDEVRLTKSNLIGEKN